MGYVGSEEFIRLQFEEYLLSLISSVKCHNYLTQHSTNPKVMLPQVEGDPTNDFGADWIEAWSRSSCYKVWDRNTDSHLFDIVEPKHPCAGGLTIDDVQRRIAEQVKEFHLDERFAVGKEVLGRNFQAGREKASTVFNKLYADMEVFRETQRRKQEEARLAAEKNGEKPPGSPGLYPPELNLNGAKQTVQSVGSKAGAYIGSWGTWMGEKRKAGWGRSSSTSSKKESPVLNKQIRHEKPRKSLEGSLFDADIQSDTSSTKVISPRQQVMSPEPMFSPRGEGKSGPESVSEASSRKSEEESEEEKTKKTVAVAEAVATPIHE